MKRSWTLLLILLLAGCHHPSGTTPPPVPSRIETSPVRVASGPLVRTLLGQVAFDPSASAQVMARIPALSVRTIRRFAGDRVRKGVVVFVMQSPDFLNAESELASVLNTGSRPSTVHGIRILAEQKLRLMGAGKEEIRRLERTRVPIDRYEVRSPLSGTIIRIGPAEGARVNTGDFLFEVSDLAHLWVQAFLYPGEERGIRRGTAVTVTPLHEKEVSGTGTISRIAPFIDPRTRTVPLRISLDNPKGLFRPDSWVRIRIPLFDKSAPPAFLVPASSVVRTREGVTVVFVKGNGRPPVPVPVSVLGEEGKNLYVRGALSVDERVVTAGLLPLLGRSKD